MLFAKALWPGLADGTVRLAFRRWKRPTVRAGSTLRSPVGVLAIDEVREIEPGDITDADAVRAGHADRTAALAALRPGDGRTLYRIAFHVIGDDPRVALRQRDSLDDAEVSVLSAALERLDAASRDGAWTRDVLDQIRRQPGVRAPDLAAEAGQETPRFKRRVRRLKELGLTESLRIGYQLSPRGAAFLAALGDRDE